MKSKKLLLMLLVVCGMVFAAESNYVQFTREDFRTYSTYQDWVPETGTSKGWTDSYMITLSVPGNSTVYLSNVIDQFKLNEWNLNPIPDLGDANIEPTFYGFNMTEGNYGYMIAEKTADGKITTNGVFHSGTGQTKDLTFYDTATGTYTQTTKGYELGYFENDTEILFVMTPNGYNTKVDSYYPVDDPDGVPAYDSILKSRQIDGYLDDAGNVVVNLGIGPLDASTGPGYRFVLGYEASNTPPPPSGQPLPGVLSTIIVACCSIACAKKMKKNK